MNKRLKITIAILMTVLLSVAGIAITAYAAAYASDSAAISGGAVCRIGAAGTGTYYNSLSEAVDAANNGDTITVISNVSSFSKTIAKTITIKSENGSTVSGVSVSVGAGRGASDASGNLTLGGNLKLSATGAMFDVKSGTLTFKDNVYAESSGNYVVDNDGGEAKIIINITDNAELVGNTSNTDKGVVGLFAKNGSELNISGNAKITQKKIGSWAIKMPTDADKTLNITGGTLSANWGTISLYANDKDVPDTIYAHVNISGGTVKADADSAIMFYGNARNAELNISGDALVTSPTKTLYVWSKNAAGDAERICRNNVINISGGTIEATKEYAIFVRKSTNTEMNISGGVVKATTARAIYANADANGFELNVTGGKVTAPKWTVMTEGNVTGAFTVAGGTVEATNGNKTFYRAHNADKMVTLDVTGGTVSANITTAYDTYDSANMDGQHAIFVGKDNASKVTISGGKVLGLYDTIDIRKVCDVTISGDAYIEAKHSYATNFTNVNLTMNGGTVKATSYTLGFLGGTNTFNMTGGSLIATDSIVLTRTAEGAVVNANISDDAKIYSAGKALKTQSGITLNISGGLVDVANTYKLAEEADVYMVEAGVGTLNITGGKFILGGSFGSAQFIAHASANTDGKSTVDGGLFVNLNTANTTLFGTNVNFVSGRAIYGDNVTAIVNGSQPASKNLQVYYGEGDDLYYFFTKLAATDAEKAGEMEKGASVRLVSGSTGIRFTTTFNAVEGATYGTIILPARYLANVTSLTYEGLTVNGVDVPAVNGIENNDGTVTVRCALTEIAPENYGVAFAAVAYMYVDGQYYFTQFNMFDNARSIETVAKAALADLTAEQDETHTYKVETAEGTEAYSPYSEAQRATLESFIVASFNLERPTGSTLMNTGSGTYSLYTAGVDANGYAAYKAYIEGLGFLKPSAMAL